MAKTTSTATNAILRKPKKKIFRHAKKKKTFNKNSRNYQKQYKGQGR